MGFLYFLCLGFIGLANAQYCFNQVHNSCGIPGSDLPYCNAKYSGAHRVMPDLQEYVMQHLSHSFQYLLMSTNFANYEKNREGFSKLYRKFSDSTWDDAIDLIKYVTKRGGVMQLDTEVPREPNPAFSKSFNMFELESLSRALDMHKSLAEKAHKIHSEVSKRSDDYHDAETLSYLEKEFVHKHSDTIRDLAGYTNDLSSMIFKEVRDPSLSVFLFDEYLQKTL
uniref:Ferritin n=1 Tax=Panstrongylus lignarius TaxID=156445 RepID=A0A224XW27_9HEMI